VVALALTAYSP